MKSLPKSVRVLIVLTIIVLAVKIAWGLAYPSATWHYKIIVEVETPEGIKTGVTVREISIAMHPEILPEWNVISVDERGEAVVVDLGSRGMFFGVMSPPPNWAFAKAFMQHGDVDPPEGLVVYLKKTIKSGERVTLTPDLYPRFIRFANIGDPDSAEEVLETEFYDKKNERHRYIGRGFRIKADHFEDFFGPGVKLKSVAIEITDEPIGTGIVNVLPWLPQHWDKMLDGSNGPYLYAAHPVANTLYAGSFSTELIKNGR